MQLAKQPPTLKMLMQKFYIFNFKFTEAKFLHNCFWHNTNCLGQMLVTIDKSLILNVYVRPIKVVSVDNIVRNNHFYYSSKKRSLFSENIY